MVLDGLDEVVRAVSSRHHQEPLKTLSDLADRPPVDIQFEDLQYYAKSGYLGGEWSQLLKSVSGQFRSGQLTAILGPSGAGKTSLMNILSGYITSNIAGSVRMNKVKDPKVFRKLCAFIEQEDTVQPHLTVDESMKYAADVKLDPRLDRKMKQAVIDEVTDLLGLQNCRKTKSNRLSGGERRRLAIALEVLGNPPVIFLDEPVTGLDNHMAKQCIQTLQKICKLGRTVICTIHQPPASLFQMFDQVYIMAHGHCVYNGHPGELVSFLSTAGCPCPQNYTPVEYTIEMVHMYPEYTDVFSKLIQNGKINKIQEDEKCSSQSRGRKFDYERLATVDFPTPFINQFRMLVSRTFLQIWRNKTVLYIQIMFHLLVGILMGLMLYQKGNNGTYTSMVFKMNIFILTLFMFTYMMCPVLLYPLEMQLLQKEYWNRWYGLRAYFLAFTVTSLPLLTVLVTIFSLIMYTMTDQPLEIERVIGFCLTGVLTAMASQGLGHTIGCICSLRAGTFISSGVMIYFFLFAIHGMGFRETIQPFMAYQMHINFLRQGLISYSNVMFYKRPYIPCTEEIMCYYGAPARIMKDGGLPLTHFGYSLSIVAALVVVFRIIWYFALKLRMSSKLQSATNVVS